LSDWSEPRHGGGWAQDRLTFFPSSGASDDGSAPKTTKMQPVAERIPQAKRCIKHSFDVVGTHHALQYSWSPRKPNLDRWLDLRK